MASKIYDVGMLAGVLASAIESVGDYYACARLAGHPYNHHHCHYHNDHDGHRDGDYHFHNKYDDNCYSPTASS